MRKEQLVGWVEPTGRRAKPVWTKKNQEQFDALLEKMTEEKAKILDTFIETYIASRWQEYFRENPERLKRIVLVEEKTSNPLIVKYYFRVKKGRLKSKLLKEEE